MQALTAVAFHIPTNTALKENWEKKERNKRQQNKHKTETARKNMLRSVTSLIWFGHAGITQTYPFG